MAYSCETKENGPEKETTLLRCAIKTEINDTLRSLSCREIDTITNQTVSKGVFLSNKYTGELCRHGWHSFFKDGKLVERIEYIIAIDSPFVENPNQIIRFNSKGDTIKGKSTYLTVTPKEYDTFRLNQAIPMKIKVNRNNNDIGIKGDYKFILIDTEEFTLIDTFRSPTPVIEFDYIPLKSGKNRLRGNVLFFENTKDKDSVIAVELIVDRNYFILE